MSTRLARLNRFLVAHSFYPLALCALLGVAFFVGRVYLSHKVTFAFLIWNLFLAWIPYLASLGVVQLARGGTVSRWLALLPAAVWLVFLPNAPYMITDLLHLDERLPVPLWYDIGFLSTFVLTGLFLAFASLRTMQTLAQQLFGRAASWLLVVATVGLSGFGIYLGRFMNFNSWDVLKQPDDVFEVVVGRMLHPHMQTYGVTLMFAAIIFVFYLAFSSLQPHADWSVE
ncbi:MAG: DUF1361 domain-containing protein [Chloroflexota bacterium]